MEKEDQEKQPELTQEQLVHSLNVLMNALIKVLVEKKILTEQELKDKIMQGFGGPGNQAGKDMEDGKNGK